MRRAVVAVLAAAGVFALAGCSGGSNTTTIHGTFTDLEYYSQLGEPCQDWAGGSYAVQVTVDGVTAASVPITWSGNSYSTTGTTACSGTWSATVATATKAYGLQVTMDGSAAGGIPPDYVSPADAGQVIALSN